MLSEILETLKSHQGEELNRVHDKAHDKAHDKVHDKYPNITDSAWNVLDYLREHNSASAAMTAEALGMSERMVRKHIATLKAVGINVGITDAEQRLLALIAGNSRTTAAQTADALSLTKRQAERLFASLRDKGIISRQGSNKSGNWIINYI